MRRLENQVLGIRHHYRLGLRRGAPKHIYDRPVLLLHRLYDRVRELFPSMTSVGIRLMSPDRQHRVQEQDALLRPLGETPGLRHLTAHIIVQFPEDVDQ